jgi:putative addiction module component (TIGR02574 family)
VDLKVTLDEIKSLSVEDRMWLVGEIWDSIADDANEPPLTEPQRHELERRLAHHLANPDDVVPWDDVRARALKRLGY